jgi:hypothetical protein
LRFIFNRIVVGYTVPGMGIRPSEHRGDDENPSDQFSFMFLKSGPDSVFQYCRKEGSEQGGVSDTLP